MDYNEFLRTRQNTKEAAGFDISRDRLNPMLFDFQKDLVQWALREGRTALFEDCGLGKTGQQLDWAQKVVEKTNGNVLIVAPLAVSGQTVREGEKFGIEVKRTRDGKFQRGISITNYEQLHKYDRANYSGIVCDESSAIKQFQGKRRGEVIRFMKKTPFRLMCTATAAPNDYIELGTHSEALGIMGQMDMLNKFFRTSDQLNHILHKSGDFWNKNKWLFKAHAEPIFWRWIVSWARALRMPSDMGYDNGDFLLPELKVNQHIVKHGKLLSGELFSKVAMTLSEQREERKLTITDRCEKVAELVDTGRPAIVWCHTNDEGDLLEKTIDGAVQVAGRHSDDEKESRLIGFTNGEIRVLVTKPSIAGFGMNWQHCDHMTFFPSHSFEQYYQATRRCWRFGQKNDVTVDIVTTEGEAGVTANLQRKADQSTKMFEMLVSLMNDGKKIDNTENFNKKVEAPKWL